MEKSKRPGKELMTLNRTIGRQISLISKEVFEENELPILTPLEAWIIGYLYRNPGKALYQKDVEAEFHVSRSTVTRTVQNMEKLGLLERSTNGQDQRMKQVRITQKAAQLHENLHADIFRRVDERIMEGISDEDMEIFYRVLERMRENLAVEKACLKYHTLQGKTAGKEIRRDD